MTVKQKLDSAQQATTPSSVTVAVFKKFSDDQSTNLAAMIAFWAFFSIFPLLLVFVTVLGWVLPASSKDSVLGHIAQMFPLLSPSTVKGLSGSLLALVLGLATSLWSGMGAVRTTQNAFDTVWEVPRHERPKLVAQVGRSLFVLVTIGAGIVLTTLISGLVVSSSSGLHLGVAGRIGGFVLSAVLSIGLFIAAFRILTAYPATIRDVLPGAVLSGIVFFILQQVASVIISNRLQHAQATYGHFGTVIVILWWFYLTAVVTLLGAQLNVVLKQRLYPRSVADAPETEADHRALHAYARERTYHPDQQVDVSMQRSQGPESGT